MALHIAVVTKQFAADGIDAKLSILNKWANEGIPWKTSDAGEFLHDADGERMLEFYPTSIASFCAWDGTQNTGLTRSSVSEICSTNRSTLYRSHMAAVPHIEHCFKALAGQARKQLKEANKTAFIGKLNVEVMYLRKLVVTQENEITEAAIKSSRIEEELLQKKRALLNLQEQYDNETQQLRTRVADLTSTLQKLTPLRKEE